MKVTINLTELSLNIMELSTEDLQSMQKEELISIIQQLKTNEPLLTQKRLKKLFNYNPDTGEFIRKVDAGVEKKGSVAGTSCCYPGERRIVTIKGKKYFTDELAFLYMEGCLPSTNETIIHIDEINHNNKWDNMSLITIGE